MDSIQPGTENIGKIYGAVCLRRQRRKRQKVLIVELLHDYAQNSTLHGLRYIVDRGLNLFDKIFWLLTFLLSIGMCFYLMSNVWIKWKTSPVIVSVNEKYVPVGDVPFPSITICPQLKCKASVFNFSKELVKMKEIEKLIRENNNSVKISDEHRMKLESKLEDLGSVCGINVNWELLIEVRRNITNSSLIKTLYEATPSVQDAFFYCGWQGKRVQCDDLFQTVITREGICFNFNSLAADEILRNENLQRDYVYLNTTTPSEDWSISEGYTDFRPGISYPKRGVANNIAPDLKVILRESAHDRDGWCNVVKSGYTIFIQHPADLPQSSRHYFAALPGQISSLAVKFSMLTADDALKGYDPEVRQCYFPGDRKLRYFRIYTISNCMLECQSNFTFKKCNCVEFHMPQTLAQAELNVKTKTINENACHCLPPCNSILYDAEILRSAYNVHTYLENRRKQYEDDDPKVEAFYDALSSLNFSDVDVYFKHSRYISMRRSELFGITDFMANCGGLLGLFLGFSFLSLVEIFYFATIRLYRILRKDLKEEKLNGQKAMNHVD
ncbi:amiloride-sensitive sodium channel domain-containing protein [Phthorimaea operculella]|nr:amiloride-sensitive sodium channel domain-containing protein [Phthorimaea operculella]